MKPPKIHYLSRDIFPVLISLKGTELTPVAKKIPTMLDKEESRKFALVTFDPSLGAGSI